MLKRSHNKYNLCFCGVKKQARSPFCRKCSSRKMMKKFGHKIGFKKGYTPWNKGLTGLITKPETVEKRRKFYENHDGPMKGKKHTLKARLQTSKALIGVNAPNWQGGITPLNTLRRHSIEHKNWREAVFKRDSWICQVCLIVGGRLDPHHIRPWRKYKEIRYDLNNGITLCKSCHKLTFNQEEKLINFFDKLLIMSTLKNRVNSGNLFKEMNTLLRQS